MLEDIAQHFEGGGTQKRRDRRFRQALNGIGLAQAHRGVSRDEITQRHPAQSRDLCGDEQKRRHRQQFFPGFR